MAMDIREGDAWPARPQDAYGMEKLYGEVLCKHYMEDYHMEMRVARLHNIYGPKGAWKGGRYSTLQPLITDDTTRHDTQDTTHTTHIGCVLTFW
jgi:nucleoside-diphosphate-sugar epimerase